MSVLRVYDPPDCNERGYPLDWEQCRSCGGTGQVGVSRDTPARERPPGTSYERNGVLEAPCPSCDGHGSLRAAALAARVAWCAGEQAYPGAVRSVRLRDDRYRAVLDEEYGIGADVAAADGPARCEGCGHPMSEGTWEPVPPKINAPSAELDLALAQLRQGIEPVGTVIVHYSPCDEGCRHGCDEEGPTGLRWVEADPPYSTVPWTAFDSEPAASEGVGALIRGVGPVEASWRQVGVRPLGWPHDLCPEKLAVLCLRCYAAGRDS